MSKQALCRICRDEDALSTMLSPCSCKGSVAYVHKECLLMWISFRQEARRGIEDCELCGTKFLITWKLKPLWKWKLKVDMNREEKTKLNIFIFSYIVATMDITRYFFDSAKKTNRILTLLLFAFASVSWIYIFSQHGKFFYSLWKRLKEQNMSIDA